MTKDKYQWSEDAVNAITTITSELSEHYNFTVTFEQAVETAAKHYVRSVLAVGERVYQRNDKLRKRIGYLPITDFHVRIHNVFESAGIEYIWQLVEMNEAELFNSWPIGRKAVTLLQEALATLDLTLDMELHPVDKALFLDKSGEQS